VLAWSELKGGLGSYTGISEGQSQSLIEEGHVYLTGNGRISMAGLNGKNVEYFCKELDRVVRMT
jgi:aspartate aminotransferase